MPLYEYRCNQCTQSFMLLQSVRVQEGETVCPHCGARKVARLFSTFSSKMEGASDSGSSPAGGHGCGSGGCGCA